MSESVFSDDDLKQLKETIKANYVEGLRINPDHIAVLAKDLEHFIARLEAAEWVVREVDRAQRHGNVSNDFIECMEAWRKCSGKDK